MMNMKKAILVALIGLATQHASAILITKRGSRRTFGILY